MVGTVQEVFGSRNRLAEADVIKVLQKLTGELVYRWLMYVGNE